MLNALENNVENKDLPNDSKLRQLSGCRDPISMVTLRTGTRLSIKNETEILIPKTMREEMMKILHRTHHTYWRCSNAGTIKGEDILAKFEKRLEEEI